MAFVHIEIGTEELRDIVTRHLESKFGDRDLDKKFPTIETKSKQNYKAEWESAEFRATYKGTI